MGIEIERKFLVQGDDWRAHAVDAQRIRQAYLCVDSPASVRVRIVNEGSAKLTVKAESNPVTGVLSRAEFEYAVPLDDALAMLDLRVGGIVEKVRHSVPAENGRTWEVDEFSGPLAGLVLAEIELSREDEEIALPGWIDREVTDDPRYANAALARRLAR